MMAWLAREQWFALPLALRKRWWRETDYGAAAPNAELTMDIMKTLEAKGMLGGTIRAPFTADQVDRLNRFQRACVVHPFTCGNDHEGDRDLFATRRGWICAHCDYTQDWAHAFMLMGIDQNEHARVDAV